MSTGLSMVLQLLLLMDLFKFYTKSNWTDVRNLVSMMNLGNHL